jgi:hypothetical protein
MLPPAHILSGYVVLSILIYSGGIEATGPVLAAAGVLALLPDIDMLWATTVTDHHSSLLHVPMTWIGVSAGLAVLPAVPAAIAILVGAETLFHLFTDYVTGRTTGVQVFYPFSTRAYSLFPRSPGRGEFSLSDGTGAIRTYLAFYVQNRAVVGIELGLTGGGVVALAVLL